MFLLPGPWKDERAALRLLFCSAMTGVTDSPKSSVVLAMLPLFPLPLAEPTVDTVRSLSAEDAVDVWIARWLRVPRKVLCQRYGCDPRRLYEIWQQEKHPASRQTALEEFRRRFPSLADRIDTGPHRAISRRPPPEQLTLFQPAKP